jgi:hypothetical protein
MLIEAWTTGWNSRCIPEEPGALADHLRSMLLDGTVQCPLCGKTGPHPHSPEEIVIYRNGVKYGRSLKSASDETSEQPVVRLFGWHCSAHGNLKVAGCEACLSIAEKRLACEYPGCSNPNDRDHRHAIGTAQKAAPAEIGEPYAGDSLQRLIADMRATADAVRDKQSVYPWITQWIERLEGLTNGAETPAAVILPYPTDKVGWICSICHGWNVHRDKYCAHSHLPTSLKANSCSHLPTQAEWCPKCNPPAKSERNPQA